MLVDDILELINDGQWHDINEIVETFNGQEKQVDLILNFYETFDLIEFNKAKNKIIIDPKVRELSL